MKDSLKKIWNIISTALVVLMVLCAVFLMGSRLMGYECYTVISGSMEPKYMVGDLIYVKEVDVNSIKADKSSTLTLDKGGVLATKNKAENVTFVVNDGVLALGSDVKAKTAFEQLSSANVPFRVCTWPARLILRAHRPRSVRLPRTPRASSSAPMAR